MQKIDAFRKFNEIIKFGEDKLKMFHTVRSKVDSYKRVIQAIINKKVNKTMKHYQAKIPSMIEDIDKSYENCRLHAVSFNKVADKIKNA